MRKKYWFVPCSDYREIPVELVEQIKALRWSYEKFELMQKQMIGHPFNLLFKLIDKKNDPDTIKGFMWCMVDPLSDGMVVQALSIDKGMQGSGKIVPLVKKFLQYLYREGKFANIYWLADRHRAYKKYGGEYSKYRLMSLVKD